MKNNTLSEPINEIWGGAHLPFGGGARSALSEPLDREKGAPKNNNKKGQHQSDVEALYSAKERETLG